MPHSKNYKLLAILAGLGLLVVVITSYQILRGGGDLRMLPAEAVHVEPDFSEVHSMDLGDSDRERDVAAAQADIALEANTGTPKLDQRSSTVVSSSVTPLESILADSHPTTIRASLKTLASNEAQVGTRLDAAESVLISAIAIHMELAGTALPLAKKGEAPVVRPARMQFMRNGRQYCFNTGEFPDWDTCKQLREDLSDATDAGDLPPDFIANVTGLGEVAVQAILQD